MLVGKGKQTTSAVQFAGPCEIKHVKLIEAGAASTLTIYDSATATTVGKTIVEYWELDADENVAGGTNLNIPCYEGCYAVLTGASAFYFIWVEPK